MARFKDFGADQDKPKEDMSFKLHGEEFICRPAIPGKAILNLVAKSSGQDNAGEAANAIGDFFKVVLFPESYERFEALAVDPDRIVSMDKLSEIVGWLAEEYADRPTSRSEALPSGQ
jgi:hypothetical protein